MSQNRCSLEQSELLAVEIVEVKVFLDYIHFLDKVSRLTWLSAHHCLSALLLVLNQILFSLAFVDKFRVKLTAWNERFLRLLALNLALDGRLHLLDSTQFCCKSLGEL